MRSRVGTTIGLALMALAVCVPLNMAQSFERAAIPLRFKPKEDSYERYMFQLVMTGAHISPGVKDELAFGEFAIGTVYKDKVTKAANQYNNHSVTFYTYNVKQLQTGLGNDRNDPRFGGNPFPNIPPSDTGNGGGGGDNNGGGSGGGDNGGSGGGTPGGGGSGGGSGGGGGGPKLNNAPGTSGGGGFIQPLGLPPHQDGPLQTPGGGGGDNNGGGGDNGPGAPPGGERAGQRTQTTVNLDTIKVTNLDYIDDPSGNVLDVGGLDLLRKVSQNQLVNSTDKKDYIDINISHVFEWSHMLRLPDYPIYKEDIWFDQIPIHVPGLPFDKPILTKFMYKLIDFRTVGDRKVAVIDMTGVTEWNTEWDNTAAGKLTEFKSWGNMGFSARYWFDYKTNTIFAITRPPFQDYQYDRAYAGGLRIPLPYDPISGFGMTYPGLAITMEFFYNTRETDVSGKPKLVEKGPQEQRRYIVLNMFCQLEAE